MDTIEIPAETTNASLEGALKDFEFAVDATAALVSRLQKAVKATKEAARFGELKALRKTLDAVEEASRRASEASLQLRPAWRWSEAEEEGHMASGAFLDELLEEARRVGLSIYEQEGYLACFPSLVKLQPKERAVLIDRKMFRRVRPSYLAGRLLERQRRGSSLNPVQFLDVLLKAYKLCNSGQLGTVERLHDIYEALTILPSARKDYSRQEFARDIYLLDGSGHRTTKGGLAFRLHPGATGAKNRANLLVVVTREGAEQTYYGIEFFEGGS